MNKNCTHSELLDTLQNLTGKRPTQQLIANAIGCDLSKINKRASRNSKYSVEDLIKIGNYFNVELIDNNTTAKVISSYSNEDIIAIDFYSDFSLCIKDGKFVFPKDKIIFNIPKNNISSYSENKYYFIILANGNSMEPDIKDGDKLIIEQTNTNLIKDDRIYVFYYNNNIFVKRLYDNIDEIIVKSDNSNFASKFIKKEKMQDFHIIGSVIGLIRNYC